ncbi:MAG: membrane protein insertase YidC [Magnetococcus sp. DMHC-6]
MDRRTLLAIALSFILLTCYQAFLALYYPSQSETETSVVSSEIQSDGQSPNVQVGKGSKGPTVEPKVTAEAAPKSKFMISSDPSQKVPFKNNLVEGEIELQGGLLSSLSFLKHLDELGPNARPIHFINNSQKDIFLAESGYISTPELALPTRETLWKASKETDANGLQMIHLTWENGSGVEFNKTFSFQPNSYLLKVTDRVINRTKTPLTLYHYVHFLRTESLPEGQNAMATADFQGPMGFLDGVRVVHSYEDIQKQDKTLDAKEGWAGFSDKYFLAALIPNNSTELKQYYFDFDPPAFRVGEVSGKVTLEPGKDDVVETNLFVGPKEIHVLEALKLKLERSIDYGWFHFLAEPLVNVLLFFNHYLNNYGLAIIFLTITIKILFFPLANKSYISMNAMKKLQPKVEELKKLYANDKQRMNQEMMKLYQENKVNPLGGCLPIVIQIPVFFALYKVLFLSVEMRHTPFFLWINDLSVHDPYYILPLLMGVSMYIQSKMNPAPPDPIQAKVMSFLPLIFTFFFLTFPSGLVLYWLVNNVLSIAQQGYIIKRNQ